MSDSRTLSNEELELAFALQRNPGSFAFVVGAGASKAAGMPSAWDVQSALIREIASAEAEIIADPAGWYEERFSEKPQYDALLSRLGKTASERQALLRHHFEATEEDRERGIKLPTVAHHALARLVAAGRVRIIVTLNFDHLIEDALRAANISVVTVSGPGAIAALNPLHAQTALVVHLHGDYLDSQSMLNTSDELGVYSQPVVDLMVQISAEYGLVIVGWSATWDPALRAILQDNPNRFYSSWWIEPGTLDNLAEHVRLTRSATLLEASADNALGRLADAADAIAESGGRDPVTVDVAIASAKRWLRGDVRAIPLHDDIKAELERLRGNELLTSLEFNSFGEAEYLRRLAMFGEITSVANGLVAAAAMWGTPETDEWWRPEIPRFASHESWSGSTALIALQNYPATAMLYAAGVGAVAGRRYELVHRLLAGTTTQDSNYRIEAAGIALEASSVIQVRRPSRTLFLQLQRIFTTGLDLGSAGYEDAWQWFEYLQMIEATFDALRGEEVFVNLEPLVTAAWAAQPSGPEYLTIGKPDEAALRKALDNVQGRGARVPHLRTAGYGAHYYPLISSALRRDLNIQGANHDLARAGFCGGNLLQLKTTISIVDRTLSERAHEAAYSVLDGGGARKIASNRFWIDEIGRDAHH